MLLTVLAALLPVILLIGFGALLRSRAYLSDDFWRQAEWLSYFVLLPALFVHGLATADLSAVPLGRIFVVLIGSILVTATVIVALRPWAAVNGAGFTSVFQGGIRFNNYVGVMVATGLYGAEGTALAAVANAAIVPTVNILSVLAFSHYSAARAQLGQVLGNLARNPLLLACVLGMALQQTGLGLPIGIVGALGTLGQASLALGLLCVGAGLRLGTLRHHGTPIVISSGFKFILLPLVTFVACRMVGLSGMEAVVVLIFQALPTATSSFILSRQMGGDHVLMANIIAVQTLMGVATIPLAALIAANWL